MRLHSRLVLVVVAFAGAATLLLHAQEPTPDGFRFRSGVELINVTATVTDGQGRFVSGLQKEDFRVFDDNAPVEVSHFSNERVPVSLGILLDTSGSMTPDKMSSARGAIQDFIELLGPDDEMFLTRFANVPELVQPWTGDRRVLVRALDTVWAGGGTALYDAVADALPYAQSGSKRKKAIVVISDGNDTTSATSPGQLKEMIRQSEVLVYAVGVDGRMQMMRGYPRAPMPLPFPIPGRGGRRFPMPPPAGGTFGMGDGLDANALRRITDDTGGHTEIVREHSDLAGATARIADELSKQYYLGYPSPGKKDGKWHAIKVEVRDRKFNVRARRGYVAS